MLRWTLLLSAILMVGCNSTDSKSDPVLDGTYQYVLTAPNGKAIIQWIFSEGGSYQGKGYMYLNDGSVDCLINEGAGKWTIADNALKRTESKSRSREACADALPDWEERPSKSDPIRNITASEFELYMAADEDSPAAWLTFTKL